MTYAERLPENHGFRIVIRRCEPGTMEADPMVAATALNRSVEACVREIPNQYQWEYKRFRHRPTGEVNPYYPDRLCK
jgi:KDO2-lipid IV(A) lauroyltransferase